MEPTSIGIAGILVLLVFFAMGLPVGFAMAVVGFLGFSILKSFDAGLSMVSLETYNTFSNYYYASAIMFIWMGFVAYHVGISKNLYKAMYTIIGNIRGGLAMTTVAACTAFGAICGSTLATTATIGAVALPEMERYRYDKALATGTVAAGGILGTMIPPSIPLIVYGIFTEQSISELFVGAIIPGMLLMACFMATIYIVTTRNSGSGPAGPASSGREKMKALLEGGTGETLVVFVVVLGGLFGDLFTPTEAGAVGAASILLVGLVRRRLGRKAFLSSLGDTAKTSAMIFLLVVGAEIFGTFMAASRLPSNLTDWAGSLPLPAVFLVCLMLLFQVIMGCFMDGIAVLLLSLPIVYPAVIALGYDPIWFGPLLTLVAGLGMITPPVGLCAYVVFGLCKNAIPLHVIFKGIIPFVWACLVCIVLLVAFPEITLFLPRLMR